LDSENGAEYNKQFFLFGAVFAECITA